MGIDFENIASWDWTTIEALVGTSEGQRIECKRKVNPATPILDAPDVDKLGKAVSGFANVSGGIYLLGVDATSAGKGIPDTISGAVPIADLARCEGSVRTALAGLLDPPPEIPEVKAIERPGTGSGVIALRVAASEVGPHCVTRGTERHRYFMRTDDDTVAMPHSVLASMFGRRAQAKLVLRAKLEGITLSLVLRNDGAGPAREPALFLIDPPTGSRDLTSLNRQDGFQLVYGLRENRGGRTGYVASITLYPGLEIDVINFQALSPFRLHGVLYTLDAKPRHFDKTIEVGRGWIDVP